MSREKVIFAWSGGKDSAFGLHRALRSGVYEVCYLLTTLSAGKREVPMHGISEELIELQAASIGIPLKKVYLSYNAPNTEYEKQMENLLRSAKTEGINTVLFGDIFLEDLRTYRETQMKKLGMNAVFPLWGINTRQLINEFVSLKFKTILCCCSDAYFDQTDAGSELSLELIDRKEGLMDACGENGEYHSFCYEGPIFKTKIRVAVTGRFYKPLEPEYQAKDHNDRIARGFWLAVLKTRVADPT